MDVPADTMVMEEQDAGELTSSIEISPVDSGSTIPRIEDKGLE